MLAGMSVPGEARDAAGVTGRHFHVSVLMRSWVRRARLLARGRGSCG